MFYIKIADECIRTQVLWYRKQSLCQLCHNYCPTIWLKKIHWTLHNINAWRRKRKEKKKLMLKWILTCGSCKSSGLSSWGGWSWTIQTWPTSPRSRSRSRQCSLQHWLSIHLRLLDHPVLERPGDETGLTGLSNLHAQPLYFHGKQWSALNHPNSCLFFDLSRTSVTRLGENCHFEFLKKHFAWIEGLLAVDKPFNILCKNNIFVENGQILKNIINSLPLQFKTLESHCSQISCQFDSSDENYDRRVFLRLASELEFKVARFFSNWFSINRYFLKWSPKLPNIWATYVRKFVGKTFQKLPNLITLLTIIGVETGYERIIPTTTISNCGLLGIVGITS